MVSVLPLDRISVAGLGRMYPHAERDYSLIFRRRESRRSPGQAGLESQATKGSLICAAAPVGGTNLRAAADRAVAVTPGPAVQPPAGRGAQHPSDRSGT